MLIYPGADEDYTIVASNQFRLHEDYTPRTAAEKGGGEAVDDILLITYVRD